MAPKRSAAPHLVEPQLKHITDATFVEFHKAIARGFQEPVPLRARGHGPHDLRQEADVRLQGRPALGVDLRRLRARADRPRWRLRADGRGHGRDGAPAVPSPRAAHRDDDLPARAGRQARRAARCALGLGVADLRAVRLRPGQQSRRAQGHQPATALPSRRTHLGLGGRGDPRGVPARRARAARVDAPRPAGHVRPRRRRLGVRDLRQGVRPQRQLGDPLRPALRRLRRRRRLSRRTGSSRTSRPSPRATYASRRSGPRTPRPTPACGATCSTSTSPAPSTSGAPRSTSPCATWSPTPAPSRPRSPTTSTSASSTSRPPCERASTPPASTWSSRSTTPSSPRTPAATASSPTATPLALPRRSRGSTLRRTSRWASWSSGTIYLGGVPLTHLHRAARVTEHTPGAVAAANDGLRLAPRAVLPGHVLR